MHLFREDFELEGKCILFDLDIKILSNPFSYIRNVDWNYPTFMKDPWKKDKFFRKHSYDTELNSSILAWTSRKNSYIWDVAAGAAIVEAAGGYVSLTNQNESFQVDVFFSNGKILEWRIYESFNT